MNDSDLGRFARLLIAKAHALHATGLVREAYMADPNSGRRELLDRVLQHLSEYADLVEESVNAARTKNREGE